MSQNKCWTPNYLQFLWLYTIVLYMQNFLSLLSDTLTDNIIVSGKAVTNRKVLAITNKLLIHI